MKTSERTFEEKKSKSNVKFSFFILNIYWFKSQKNRLSKSNFAKERKKDWI